MATGQSLSITPQNVQMEYAPQLISNSISPASPFPQAANPNIATTPIALYPTGATAIVPAPPTYEVIPNRIFVGGYPQSTNETDLREHFEKFFPVKDVKMIKSLEGASKGYGFITFETEDQAEEVRRLAPHQLEFRNRKLNLGPAIRKTASSPYSPGYAIAAPSQLVPASPAPYAYTLGHQTPQMFVFPPVSQSDAGQTTPLASPTCQQQFFVSNCEKTPTRSYANAVGKGSTPEAANGAVSHENVAPITNIGYTLTSPAPPKQNNTYGYNFDQAMRGSTDAENGGIYNDNSSYYSPNNQNNNCQYVPVNGSGMTQTIGDGNFENGKIPQNNNGYVQQQSVPIQGFQNINMLRPCVSPYSYQGAAYYSCNQFVYPPYFGGYGREMVQYCQAFNNRNSYHMVQNYLHLPNNYAGFTQSHEKHSHSKKKNRSSESREDSVKNGKGGFSPSKGSRPNLQNSSGEKGSESPNHRGKSKNRNAMSSLTNMIESLTVSNN